MALMRRIDELYTAGPVLRLSADTAMLHVEGSRSTAKCVQRLMRLMGIAALGPKPNTSKAGAGA